MGRALFSVLAAGLCASAVCFAKTTAVDSCQDHCTLERHDDGTLEPLCSCTERRFTAGSDSIFALSKRSGARYRQELGKRLRGASDREAEQVAANECAAPRDDRAANEFLLVAGLAQRPLCECVSSRVRFPVRRDCIVTGAGVPLCRFDLVLVASARRGSVRNPTLQDYQACIAARANYRRPASCQGVVCRDQPRTCGTGRELVNVADVESCCPIFECRAGEES